MPIPVSRYTMRGLKARKDEDIRIEMLNNYVKSIYEQAILMAETTTNTTYSLDIDPEDTYKRIQNINDPRCSQYKFYKDNMEEILSSLKVLFPDCSVKLANMCSGKDRKRYDISLMDEKVRSFINMHEVFECIVVDWT